MFNQLTCKTFVCTVCKTDVEMMTHKDSNPEFVCDICRLNDKTKNIEIVQIDGAPIGYVKGSQFKVRQSNPKDVYKG